MSILKLILDATYKGGGAFKVAKQDVESIGESAQKSGKKFNDFLGNAEAQFLAVAAAGAVFVEALDMAEEGANIAAMTDRFNALVDSIDGGADTLQRLTEITGGAIDNLGAMESASQLMAMGLVQSEDELLKLFDTVNKLKSPTDDLTDSMENFSLMLANQSVARLDSFGISSGAVRTRMNELKEETDGMTSETAFFIATMEEAENTMQRTGTAAGVTANSFTRVKVGVTDWYNELKVLMAEGLDPVAKLMLGDYKRGIESTISGHVDAIGAIEDHALQLEELQAQLIKTKTISGVLTGAHNENKEEVAELLATQIEYTDAMKIATERGAQYEKANQQVLEQLRAVYGEQVKLTRNHIDLGNGVLISTRAIRAYAGAQAEAERETRIATEAMQLASNEQMRMEQASRQTVITLDDVAEGMKDVALASQLVNRQTQSLSSAQSNLAANTSDAIKAQREAAKAAAVAMVPAFKDANSLIDRMIENEQELAETSTSTADVIIDNSWAIQNANSRLANDLTSEQKDAYADILNTVEEGSQQWLDAYNALQNDLTDSERQGVVARLAELESANGQMGVAYTGDREAYEAAIEEKKRLNDELITSYQEVFSASLLANQGVTQSTLDTLVAVGAMTQEEADRTLQVTQTTTALEELAKAGDFNTLSLTDQAEAYQLLIDGEAKTAEEAINLAEQFYIQQGATASASEAAIDLKNNLLAIDGMTVTATMNLNTVGSFPTDPQSGLPVVPQDAIDSGDVTQRDGGGVGLSTRGLTPSVGGGGSAGNVQNFNFYMQIPNPAMAQRLKGILSEALVPRGRG